MSALADTSVLVDYLRGVEAARALLGGAAEQGRPIYGSTLSRIELSAGMRKGERRVTDALVAALVWLPVDQAVIDAADALARRYGPSHSGIDAVDYCIAATTRVHDLDLWTLNVRHFPMIAKLQAPY